jgi:hypothetical protein
MTNGLVQRSGAQARVVIFSRKRPQSHKRNQKFHRAYREEVSYKEAEDYQIFNPLTIIILTKVR